MNMEESKREEKEEESEECQWCNSTGDVNRTRRLYWFTVGIIVLLIAFLYVLSKIY